ncbi:NAD(P)/FAD-dependent oxidoreductase [Devosia sp.]|uniref:NAD(P)/FAD-dependent oxidoreductase n=1 Tax=Devosia sp. TaxID=1871048 RepID=UPI003A942F79
MSPTTAVIGSGISGLSSAWLLGLTRDVTVFESAGRLGGHSNTVMAATPDGEVPVDTGFIVFNEQNYPNLCALFDELGVTSAQSSMSFAVSVGAGRMEYSGEHLNGLFGQRRNLMRIEHWYLVADILRFFREAERQVAALPKGATIGEFLAKYGYSQVFIEDHILPISAAIWSTPARSMLEFPADSFVAFFANHGLLQVNDRPKWRTVTGGSRQYVERFAASGRFKTVLNAGIASVIRHTTGAEIIFEDGSRQHFDEVIFACHADQALALLADPTDDERRLLGAFRFTENRAVLHTDARFMPRRKRLWSSWNYLRSHHGPEEKLSLSYWMNKLQPLKTTTDIFVTLNPGHEFAEGSVQYDVTYEHPLFDRAAMDAQRDIWRIQGVNGTWFAGAWLGYGFHEDGLQSGLEVAERLGGVERPWNVTTPRGRVAHNWADAEDVLWAAE